MFKDIYILLKTHFHHRNRTFRSGRVNLADSVWPFRSEPFRSEPFRPGRFGHGTFRSDHEILQKSYINAKTSRLIPSALPLSSYCRLPKVETFHSKRAPFTIRNSGKRCRQGISLGIKFKLSCKVTESVVYRA